jgi:hypothetical protein
MPALTTPPARPQPTPQAAPEPSPAAPDPTLPGYVGDRIALALWVVCAVPLAWLLFKDLVLALLRW